MANETKLTLRLVDAVSGPGKAAAKTLGMLNRSISGVTSAAVAPGRAIGGMARSIRRSTYDIAPASAAIGMVGTSAAKQVFEFEKVGNALEAVTGMTDKQRTSIEAYAKELNALFPATNAEIMGAAFELGRAGQTYEQVVGSLKSTLNLALAGDIGIPRSADIITNVVQAMRLASSTQEEAVESTARTADALAYSANKSNANIEELGITFKYVAPLAAAAGMSLQEMAVNTMALANNGIKGSNAGTGLRWMLSQIISPSEKAQGALAKLNIDLGDFVTGARKIAATDVVDMLALDNIDATGLEDQIQKMIDSPGLAKSPAKLAAAIAGTLTDSLGVDNIIDRKELVASLNESLKVLGTEVDFQGFMQALRDNPDSEAYLSDIFGRRHFVKGLAIMAMDTEKQLADFEANYRGAADRMSKIRMKGVVGDWYRLTASIENLWITLSDTGVLTDAQRAITGFADSIDMLGKQNPTLLRFGTYAILALGALAPLGWALSSAAAGAAVLLNPLTGIAAALGTIAYLNFGDIVDFLDVFGSSAKTAFNPAILESINSVKESITGLFSGGLLGDPDEIGQNARNMGLAFADGVNALWESGGKLKDFGGEIAAFAEGEWANRGPQIRADLDNIKEGLSGFVIPRIETLRQLGPVIGDFLSRIAETADGTAALDAASQAFSTFASAIQRLGTMAGNHITNMGSFLTGLFENIDQATIQTVSDAVAGSLNDLKNALSGFSSLMGEDIMPAWPMGWAETGKAFADYLDSVVSTLKATSDTISELRSNIRSTFTMGLLDSEAGAGSDGAGMTEAQKRALLGTGVAAQESAGGSTKRIIEVETKVDTSEMDAAAQKGVQTGASIQTNVGVSVTPSINTSSIDAAHQKALALGAALRAAGSTSPGAAIGSMANPPRREWAEGTAQPTNLGRKASGGHVRRGMSYWVNERTGREGITLGASNGYVTPAHKMGGGGGDTHHYHIQSSDPQEVARAIEARWNSKIRRSNQTALDGRSQH